MKSRVLTHIQQSLMKLALWRGWTTNDRILLRQMAGQAAEMNRRYTARHTVLHREEGSTHVARR